MDKKVNEATSPLQDPIPRTIVSNNTKSRGTTTTATTQGSSILKESKSPSSLQVKSTNQGSSSQVPHSKGVTTQELYNEYVSAFGNPSSVKPWGWQHQKKSFLDKYGYCSLAYTANPRLLCLLWAAANTDFDLIIEDYLCNPEWDFHHLAASARKWDIARAFYCTQVPYEYEGYIEADNHYLIATYTLLEAAKTQWLPNFESYTNNELNASNPSSGPIVSLKTQVGGFFLLYMLYTQQPKSPVSRQDKKILISPADVEAAECFFTKLVQLKSTPSYNYGDKLIMQVKAVWNDLKGRDAFEYSLFQNEYNDANSPLSSLNALKNGLYWQKIQEFKHCRDATLAAVLGDPSLKISLDESEQINTLLKMMKTWTDPSQSKPGCSKNDPFLRRATRSNPNTASASEDHSRVTKMPNPNDSSHNGENLEKDKSQLTTSFTDNNQEIPPKSLSLLEGFEKNSSEAESKLLENATRKLMTEYAHWPSLLAEKQHLQLTQQTVENISSDVLEKVMDILNLPSVPRYHFYELAKKMEQAAVPGRNELGSNKPKVLLNDPQEALESSKIKLDSLLDILSIHADIIKSRRHFTLSMILREENMNKEKLKPELIKIYETANAERKLMKKDKPLDFSFLKGIKTEDDIEPKVESEPGPSKNFRNTKMENDQINTFIESLKNNDIELSGDSDYSDICNPLDEESPKYNKKSSRRPLREKKLTKYADDDEIRAFLSQKKCLFNFKKCEVRLPRKSRKDKFARIEFNNLFSTTQDEHKPASLIRIFPPTLKRKTKSKTATNDIEDRNFLQTSEAVGLNFPEDSIESSNSSCEGNSSFYDEDAEKLERLFLMDSSPVKSSQKDRSFRDMISLEDVFSSPTVKHSGNSSCEEITGDLNAEQDTTFGVKGKSRIVRRKLFDDETSRNEKDVIIKTVANPDVAASESSIKIERRGTTESEVHEDLLLSDDEDEEIEDPENCIVPDSENLAAVQSLLAIKMESTEPLPSPSKKPVKDQDTESNKSSGGDSWLDLSDTDEDSDNNTN